MCFRDDAGHTGSKAPARPVKSRNVAYDFADDEFRQSSLPLFTADLRAVRADPILSTTGEREVQRNVSLSMDDQGLNPAVPNHKLSFFRSAIRFS